MKSLLAMLALLFTVPALGAPSLAASREAAQASRAQMTEIRGRQMAMRKDLNQVAAHIEVLKEQRKGKLLSGGELDAALRRSQELSGALTGLAKSLSSAEAAVERENVALSGALSEELARLRGEFDRTIDRQARQKVIEQMRALRAEREQVRAALPATSVPALEAPSSSDDPEDLLEQADALRDNEDKVRRELKALEGRIAERREERELDRRMSEFLGDESIFDDQDRRFRLRRDSVERVSADSEKPPGDRGPFGGAPAEAREVSAAPAPPAAGDFNNFGSAPSPNLGAKDVNQNEKAPTSGTETLISRFARGSDARPQVGDGHAKTLSEDDLEDLEAQQAKLKGLAEELKVRAQKLEERAKALR